MGVGADAVPDVHAAHRPPPDLGLAMLPALGLAGEEGRPCSCCRDRGLTARDPGQAPRRTPSFPSRERHYAVRRKNRSGRGHLQQHRSLPETLPELPEKPLDAVGLVLRKLEALDLASTASSTRQRECPDRGRGPE